jgi:hypothetical protein
MFLRNFGTYEHIWCHNADREGVTLLKCLLGKCLHYPTAAERQRRLNGFSVVVRRQLLMMFRYRHADICPNAVTIMVLRTDGLNGTYATSRTFVHNYGTQRMFGIRHVLRDLHTVWSRCLLHPHCPELPALPGEEHILMSSPTNFRDATLATWPGVVHGGLLPPVLISLYTDDTDQSVHRRHRSVCTQTTQISLHTDDTDQSAHRRHRSVCTQMTQISLYTDDTDQSVSRAATCFTLLTCVSLLYLC